MLQKLETPVDRIAQIPTSRSLEKARERLAEAVRLEEAAAAEFRTHCKRVGDTGRWVRHDALASAAETEAIKNAAATRLAGSEVETVRRAHGETLSRHLAKHESACLELLIDELRSAHVTARKIAKAVEVAEHDGASPSLKLRKARRAANDLQNILQRLK